jgi:DNA-binding XRE family transcriptional regulator
LRFSVPEPEEAAMRGGKNARGRKYRALGRAVRECRARRGLSQEELSFMAGLHRNYVGAIERGEINPTLRVIFKLARGLVMLPSELLQLAEQHHGALDRAPGTSSVPLSASSSNTSSASSSG